MLIICFEIKCNKYSKYLLQFLSSIWEDLFIDHHLYFVMALLFVPLYTILIRYTFVVTVHHECDSEPAKCVWRVRHLQIHADPHHGSLEPGPGKLLSASYRLYWYVHKNRDISGECVTIMEKIKNFFSVVNFPNLLLVPVM